MYRFFTPLLRRLYTLLGGFLIVYGSIITLEQSPWNKERLYRKLVSGIQEEKASAGFDLASFGAEEQLVRALKSRSAVVRKIAVNSLWELWIHAGGQDAFQMTQTAGRALEKKAYPEAMALLTRLTQKHPTFAEGWNRRATLYWQLGQYEESIADCKRVVTLNPNHFGAWQGMAVCQLHLGNLEEACTCLRATLKVNPHDRGARRLLWRCEELLEKLSREPKRPYDII